MVLAVLTPVLSSIGSYMRRKAQGIKRDGKKVAQN